MNLLQPDELQTYLDEDPSVRPLVDWVWGLSRWGRPVLIRAALALAEACVARWFHGAPLDDNWQRHYAVRPLPREALRFLRSALERGVPADDAQLQSHTEALRELVRKAEFEAYEYGGDTSEQRPAAASARVGLLALEAARWTAERACAGVTDEAERQALASAGPALELWEAVRAFRLARPQRTSSQVREIIRDALRDS